MGTIIPIWELKGLQERNKIKQVNKGKKWLLTPKIGYDIIVSSCIAWLSIALAVGPNGVIFQISFVGIVLDSLGCQKHKIS